MTDFTIAALCTRGHVQSLNAGPAAEGDFVDGVFCEDCGASVIDKCLECKAPILGVQPYAAEDGSLDTSDWAQPTFCGSCGSPYPWVDRAGRIHHLQNLLDRERLDEGTTLAVREQLDALLNPDLDDKAAEKRWKRVQKLAPSLWNNVGAKAVIASVTTAYVKHRLNL